jgi:hypothetical protein
MPECYEERRDLQQAPTSDRFPDFPQTHGMPADVHPQGHRLVAEV